MIGKFEEREGRRPRIMVAWIGQIDQNGKPVLDKTIKNFGFGLGRKQLI
uniref:Uncharacterized protein n=1 Tax=Candidatus Kentrum sp. FM TaxID=2126340 RepID=A0A450STI0_9GAMM|nr:MAG: hypothetical protein BECKFM1743A_GA0114220_1003212 [Candidatus Kentron sp. FM]VFJ57158.1 MAG: hypothetical protein BECKFM1743C_GA0114222_101924 [Candidatus Kentron sp. FM]VFK06415.1 MAG: hypothetical protein BECKFM1743B_GA0114221_100172 [Candidatus Kentron sp. FM]